GRQGGYVSDAGIRAERVGQAGAAGTIEKLSGGRQTGIAARDAEYEGVRWVLHAGDVGRRQEAVEHLARSAGADEEIARTVGRRRDLELMRAGEVRSWRAIGFDDALGEQIAHPFIALGDIGCEQMIEAAVLADDDDDVLDWARGRNLVDRLVRIGGVAGSNADERGRREQREARRGPARPSRDGSHRDPPDFSETWRREGRTVNRCV